MDEASAQLHLETRDAIVRSFATRRPILHHLNADTSWLLQVPRPSSAVKRGSRVYFNILIDPWLQGPQSDVARWFSQQWHATESKVKSIKEVEALAREIEVLAGNLLEAQKDGHEEDVSYIDAVAISHEFTDHCHEDTLREVHPDVPVYATEHAARLITSYNHFRTVITTPTFPTAADWHEYSLPPLPPWLSITRLTASKDALYYHSALLISFSTHSFLSSSTRIPTPKKKRASLSIYGDDPSAGDPTATEPAECIIYTPHGIPHTALAPIATADPPLHTLAFLHGLHDVSISAAQQLNLGAKNGVLAQKTLRAKYWVATHDEVKKGGGFVSWFLRRKVWTVEDAVREASADVHGSAANGGGGGGAQLPGTTADFDDVRFEDVENGESRVLE